MRVLFKRRRRFGRAVRILWAFAVLTPGAAMAQDPGTILPGSGPEPTVQTTFYGPSGLIRVPTAYTALRGDARLGTAFENGRRSLVGNYGIYTDIEVGGGWIERDGRDGKAIANGKVRIQAANFRNVDIGIGVIDAFDAVDQSVYVIGSVDLIPPPVDAGQLGRSVGLKAHLGYGSGVFNDHIIGGGELILSRDFSIIGEYDGDQASFALRFSRATNFSVQAGVTEKRLFVGFTAGTRF